MSHPVTKLRHIGDITPEQIVCLAKAAIGAWLLLLVFPVWEALSDGASGFYQIGWKYDGGRGRRRRKKK